MFRRLFMVLKASPVNRGGRLVRGVEAFFERFVDPRLKEARVEERIAELRQALHLAPAAPPQPGLKPEEVKSAEVKPVEVKPVDVKPVDVKPAEVKSAGAKSAEAKLAEAKLAEVKLAEVKLAEVKLAEVKLAEVKSEPPPPAVAPVVPVPVPVASSAPAPAPATVPAEPVRPRARAKRPAPKKLTAAAVRRVDPLTQLLAALEAHPKRSSLVKAGREKDQLLRSLIPLYLAQPLLVEVSSGTTSRFWAKQGVKYAAPNAAKALREHEGYSKRTATGPRITPTGVKYVEAALASH
jgi:hypothetical protein